MPGNTSLTLCIKIIKLFHLEGHCLPSFPEDPHLLSFFSFTWFRFSNLHDQFGIYRHLNGQLLDHGLKSSSLASHVRTIWLINFLRLTSHIYFLFWSFLLQKYRFPPKTLCYIAISRPFHLSEKSAHLPKLYFPSVFLRVNHPSWYFLEHLSIPPLLITYISKIQSNIKSGETLMSSRYKIPWREMQGSAEEKLAQDL